MKFLFYLFRALIIFLISRYYIHLVKLVGFEQVVFKISTLPYRLGNSIRLHFYRTLLKSVGENVTFSYGCVITNRATSIGNNVRIGPFNTIGWANIGDNVLMAQYIHILSGAKQHGFQRTDIPIMNQSGEVKCVTLAGDNWIGANVVIMDDIGEGTIIGSGAVVVKSIANNVIAAGNPCKVVKSRI